jgi:hypothetical protein
MSVNLLRMFMKNQRATVCDSKAPSVSELINFRHSVTPRQPQKDGYFQKGRTQAASTPCSANDYLGGSRACSDAFDVAHARAIRLGEYLDYLFVGDVDERLILVRGR